MKNTRIKKRKMANPGINWVETPVGTDVVLSKGVPAATRKQKTIPTTIALTLMQLLFDISYYLFYSIIFSLLEAVAKTDFFSI